MRDQMRRRRSKFRVFAIGLACLGLTAIGASSASAAEPAHFTFTGTANNVVIYGGGSEGVIRCEKVTIAGSLTASGVAPNETRNGTVTSITPTKCIYPFANVPISLKLNSPWTVSVNVARNTATVTGFNFHAFVTPEPEIYFDATGGQRTFASGGWIWRKENTLAVTSSNFAFAYGMAKTGPGYIEATFNVAYTKVS